MSRKTTPDIMANLMGLEYTDKPQKNHNTIKEELPMQTIAHVSNNEIRPENNKAIIENKEKTTFNLSTRMIDQLEDVWIKLRKQFKNEQRISKTLIVEKALEMALNDFESKNEASDLYIKLKN